MRKVRQRVSYMPSRQWNLIKYLVNIDDTIVDAMIQNLIKKFSFCLSCLDNNGNKRHKME